MLRYPLLLLLCLLLQDQSKCDEEYGGLGDVQKVSDAAPPVNLKYTDHLRQNLAGLAFASFQPFPEFKKNQFTRSGL
jgi:hypothetical protein